MTLYVVATPLGNLEDITIRAIKILLSVSVVACEDTRHTGQLLKILEERYLWSMSDVKLASNRRYVSVRDWNEAEMVNQVINILQSEDVALVSDAGTPLISDPGFKVVRAAREAGIKVVPVPGPSALTAAMSAAGLPTNKFMFWGFLPKSKLPELEPKCTHVIYEAPDRVGKLIGDIQEKYPEADVVAAKELTKIHEEFLRGTDLEKLKAGTVKGEVVVLVYLQE